MKKWHIYLYMNGWLDLNIAKMCIDKYTKKHPHQSESYEKKHQIFPPSDFWTWKMSKVGCQRDYDESPKIGYGVLVSWYSATWRQTVHAHPAGHFCSQKWPFFFRFFLRNDEELCTNQFFCWLVVTSTLPKTRQQKNLKIGRALKGKTCLPTTSFQGLC